jgi:tetratricopeptide (TPR) repeat protein
MGQILRNIVLSGCLLFAVVPAWADGVDDALQLGARALAGSDMGKAVAQFNRAIKSGKPTRLQLFTAYSGLCASRYKQSMINKDKALTIEAITDCDRAIALKSDQQSVYRMRGIANLTVGAFDRSVADLNVAVALNPNDYLSIQNRGLAKAKLGRSDAAIIDFDRSIALKPGHPWGYYNRGRLHAILYRYKKAVEDFSTFIRFKQDFEPVFLHRGWSRMRLGYYQQAVGDFYEAIRLKENSNPQALANRGIALYLLGRYEEAAEDFEMVLKLDPAAAENRFWLYLVRTRLGRPAREVFSYGGGVIDAKSWPGALAAYLLGHAESISVLDTIRENPDPVIRGEQESLAIFIFGEWAAIRERTESARKWFNIIVNKAGPNPPWFYAAKQQVGILKSLPPQQARAIKKVTSIINKAEEKRKRAAVISRQKVSKLPEKIAEKKIVQPAVKGKLSHRDPASKLPKKIAEKKIVQRAAKGRYPHKPGSYAFKLASFQNLEHTDKALADATELGYGVYLEEIMVDDDRYLRVWVGPFDSLKKANAARDELKKLPGRSPSKVRLR